MIMRKNNWDAMPPEYYIHIEVCRWVDGGDKPDIDITKIKRSGRRPMVLGWIHKALAFRPKYADNEAVILAHRRIKRQRVRPSSMYEYRKGVKMCEVCNKAKPVDTHHIIPKSKGGADCHDNYLAVCLECHSGLHKDLPKAMFFRRRPFAEIARRSK